MKKQYSKRMKMLPSTVDQIMKLLSQSPVTPAELKDVLPLDKSAQSKEGCTCMSSESYLSSLKHVEI